MNNFHQLIPPHQGRYCRQGTVLIVVAGMAALLLTMFLVLTRQVRAEVTDGSLVLRDAQARITLSAAISYILETARFGCNADEETFGWTDVRDGGAGPKGPLTAAGVIPSDVPEGSTWPMQGSIKRCALQAWKCPPNAIFPSAAYNPVSLPGSWITEWEQTTEAGRWNTKIGKILAPTKVNAPLGVDLGFGNISQNAANWIPTSVWASPQEVLNDAGLYSLYGSVYATLYSPTQTQVLGPEYDNSLQPQPIQDTKDDFVKGGRDNAGSPVYRPESQRRTWFRIYRERPADHDGSGTPWYNREKITGNHGIFIVTCGAGETEGYRDFADFLATNPAEVSKFRDKPIFEDLRRQERILWYRVRWSGFVGGGVDLASDYGAAERQFPQVQSKIQFSGAGGYALPGFQYPLRQNTNRLLQRRYSMNPQVDEHTSGLTAFTGSNGAAPDQVNPRVLLNTTGTIAMIERLEREPPVW